MSLGRTLRTIRHLRPEQVAWRIWFRASRRWRASGLYVTALGAAPVLPHSSPKTLSPGDVELGRLILSGRIRLLNHEATLGDWTPADATPLWRFTLNYFEWLADLRAANGNAAARALVADWWSRHHACMASEPWHPYPTSLRLFAWLAHGEWLLDGASVEFRRLFAAALDRHARHLARMVERDVAGNHIVKNLKALAAAAVCLPGHRHRLEAAFDELRSELDRQILPDGCHYERSPAYHAQVLADLAELRTVLSQAPTWLNQVIARMAPALAFFRHGDGRLAQFNDGDEGEVDRLDRLPRAAAPLALPDAGYHRLVRDDMLAVFDTGLCCPDDLPAHAHADTLSFELSVGAERLVVNCGTYAYQDPRWRNVLRGTKSHSTLTVDDMDSAEVYGIFRLGRRPRRVWSRPEGGGVVGGHDGWAHLGVVHRRWLALEAKGLTGRDEVDGALGRVITARFHLHPNVAADLDGDSVVLRLTGGGRWRFTAAGGTISLGEGIYAPAFGVMRTNRHLALSAPGTGGTTGLTWQLERLV